MRFNMISPLVAVVLMTTATSVFADKPNVVVFLADDSGWGDYSINGNNNLKTPNIDSIARQGVTLDRFYVCPVCSPTRAEFLTGRYHPRCGVRGVSTGQERLNLDEKTIADAFANAGYATGAFGKWHNGSQWPYHPNARGFREYYGFTSGHWGEYFDPPLDHNGRAIRGKGYTADDFTSHAISFMEASKEKPFFTYIAFNTPHSPWAVPDNYWQKFKDHPIPLRSHEGGRENLPETRCALAMMENLDWNVGRVLAKLQELKLDRNTIVIYFSDNGPNTWRFNGGMKGRKGTTDEGGVRSACFMKWPAGNFKPGTTMGQISGAIDLLPTLCGLTGISRVGNKPLDGIDLSEALKGKPLPERMIFSAFNGNVSVRTQQHRLDNMDALYDMVKDPGQTKNIASENTAVAKRLKDAVTSWRKEVYGLADTPATKAEAKGKGLGKKLGLPADERPFPVGYPEFPVTTLPARDGISHGGIKRSAPAPNCSYFVNWKSKEDFITWDIEVNTPGSYEVVIHYTCREKDAGATIELGFLNNKIQGKVGPVWDPPLYTNQDTIPRPPAESIMKEFRPLRLGAMKMEKGRGLLKLKASDIPGEGVMDVRLVELTLKN